MAKGPIRPCVHVGCSALTRNVYCEKHRPKDAAQRSDAAKDWHSWYRLPIWLRDLRPAQLMREPYCRECSVRGIRAVATDVDHITPHRGDWELFIDPSNHQSLCHSCHSRKTAEEMRQILAQKRR